jgi:hypothetical protein
VCRKFTVSLLHHTGPLDNVAQQNLDPRATRWFPQLQKASRGDGWENIVITNEIAAEQADEVVEPSPEMCVAVKFRMLEIGRNIVMLG